MDELAAKLKINLTGNKSYYLYNGTELYYNQMRAAYKDIKNEVSAGYLYFSFFTLCAATLEYSLNYILANYCVEKFGVDRYKVYLDEFISLKFKNKLLMTPHLISDGKFVMNEDCEPFKKLCEMINLRNRILHNKEFLTEFELPLNLEVKDGEILVPEAREIIDFEIVVKNPIDRLTKENCLAYGLAMGHFKRFIMRPAIASGLDINSMILLA